MAGGALDSLFTVPGRVRPSEPPELLPPPAAAGSALGLRREVWVIPVIVISAMNVLVMLAFEAYVLFKVSRTSPSRRHVFLGQVLLAGLLLASLSAGVYVFEPSVTTCALVRLGTGLAYALTFAALLVKCVFLISLNAGVYLPANYQALLLFFVVLTQLATSVQWLAAAPPRVEDGACAGASFHTHLLTLLYPLFLLVLVTCLAVRSRHIKDNYREAAYIGAAAALSVLVWCTWVVAGLVATPMYRDAAASLGLAVNAALVFLVMFMPKGRQLAALGTEGVRREDRDDRLSLSYADPRATSPSFYHFRPVKVQSAVTDRRRKSTPLQLPLPSYYQTPYLIPRCSGYIRQDDNMYNTIDHIKSQYRGPAERTLSAGNPNVFFYRTPPHPGMMY